MITRITNQQLDAYSHKLTGLTEAEVKQELHGLTLQRQAAEDALQRIQQRIELPEGAPGDLDLTNPEALTDYFRSLREEGINSAGVQSAVTHLKNVTAKVNRCNSVIRDKACARVHAAMVKHVAANRKQLEAVAQVVREHLAIAGETGNYPLLEASIAAKIDNALSRNG
jgi:hypothetical protein